MELIETGRTRDLAAAKADPARAWRPMTSVESGVLSATAASVLHAGVMAELIESGTPWAGPVHYAEATDYQRADEMLRPAFGCHASGAHAYAQQVALHVLQARWADVELVAAELVRTGRWSA